jgi:hypothetical protein
LISAVLVCRFFVAFLYFRVLRVCVVLQVDVAYTYLKFFLEDDAELQRITDECVGRIHVSCPQVCVSISQCSFFLTRCRYGSGRMTTVEVKHILTGVLQKVVSQHQEVRLFWHDECAEYVSVVELATA